MGSGIERVTAGRKSATGAQRAEAARDRVRNPTGDPSRAFPSRLGPEPLSSWSDGLSAASEGARARVVGDLQRTCGNVGVQRMVSSSSISVQRDDLGDVDQWPVDYGNVDEWPETQAPVDYGNVDEWPDAPRDLGNVEDWPESPEKMSGKFSGITGVIDNSLKAAELLGTELPGGFGVANDVLGGVSDFTNYRVSGQSTTEAALSTAGGFLAGKGMDFLGVSQDPSSILINGINSGLQAADAPQEVTDVSNTLSSVTPSQFGKDLGASTVRGLYNVEEGLRTDDWSGLNKQTEDIQTGKSGGALQGWGMLGGLTGDLLGGKDLESSILDVGSKGANDSALGRMGGWLGNQAYQLIEKDIPDLAHFAKKDATNLWNKVTGNEPTVDEWGNPY